MEIVPIAHIRNAYAAKFGVPRQSGLVRSVPSEIVFEPAFRNPDALRGLEDFSHVWAMPGWGCSPPGRPSGPTGWG